MAKFDVIVIDPPYSFNDKLDMSKIKRGAASQYKTMTKEEIKALPIGDLAEDDSLLVLWVVGSQLQLGLDLMSGWGFTQTQTWVWVKTKNKPLESLVKLIKEIKDEEEERAFYTTAENVLNGISKIFINFDKILDLVVNFNLHDILSFKMGRVFRQTHEICLIGVKGSLYRKIQNRSQRSVCFDICQKHSQKTEILQDRLETIFGEEANYLEVFARRQRKNWICVGNESKATKDQDVLDSLNMLKKV